jgi:hypothetical protein
MDFRRHAKLRLAERYQLELNPTHKQDIIGMIQTGDCIIAEKQSLRRAVYLVNYRQRWFACVYRRKKSGIKGFSGGEIITFLSMKKRYLELVENFDEEERILIALTTKMLRTIGYKI